MTSPSELGEDEYLAIEDALSASTRGRAFLRQRDARAERVAVDEVRKLVRGLRTLLRKGLERDGHGEVQLRVLRQELQEMSHCIQQTRTEIAALRPDEAGNSWISTATEELDAIVSATERATSDILGAAEQIQAIIGKLPQDEDTARLRDAVEAQVTEILTACSFQDITGQRTTKVVNALRFLERRIHSMLEIWGSESGRAGAVPEANEDKRPDAHLLNGPALRGGVTQDDVDALFSAMDTGGQNGKTNGGGTVDQNAIDAMFD